MTGNQGNQWNSISVDLSTYAGSEIIVQFAAETGSTWQGDVAIDNLSLSTSGSGGGGSDCDGSA
ncbi:MAG TPA: hypothetical protein DCP28_18320, partial [Cytophagales bacterium]|nr:hypothetical protein [Cytophagales bacterium]